MSLLTVSQPQFPELMVVKSENLSEEGSETLGDQDLMVPRIYIKGTV